MKAAVRVAVAAPDIVLAVTVEVAMSMRRRIAVLIMPLGVADLLPSGVPIRIVVVAVVAAAPNRSMAVTVMVRVRAGRVAEVAILVAPLSSATRRRPADAVAAPDAPLDAVAEHAITAVLIRYARGSGC
jgi:hypothetical protein